MSVLPEGEQLRRAIKWISDLRGEDPALRIADLLDRACLKFDLSPKDAEALMHFFTGQSD